MMPEDLITAWQDLHKETCPFEAAIKLYVLIMCQFRVGEDYKHMTICKGLPVIYDETLPPEMVILETIIK